MSGLLACACSGVCVNKQSCNNTQMRVFDYNITLPNFIHFKSSSPSLLILTPFCFIPKPFLSFNNYHL